IPISPLITKRVRPVGTPRTRRRRETGTGDDTVSGLLPTEPAPPPAPPSSPAEVEWAKFRLLVDKFPRFDPTWPDELKKKWFETYDQFMKTNLGGVVKD